jgi:hypothetical protein
MASANRDAQPDFAATASARTGSQMFNNIDI